MNSWRRLTGGTSSPPLDVRRVALFACTAAVALAALLCMRIPVPNHDIWHEMALARESLRLSHVPTTDLYSYAPTLKPVVDHEWLAGVIGFAVFSIAGLKGFTLLWFGLTSALWLICLAGLRGTRPSVQLGAAAVMAPFVMYSQFQPCVAQAYSSVLAAVTLLIVQADARSQHRRWLLLCLPLSVLWVNLHGGAVIGIIIMAAYSLECRLNGRPYRIQLGTAAAMAAAFAASPFGLSYYPYLARALTMPRPEIGQWTPFWFLALNDLPAWLFVGSLVLLIWAIRRNGVSHGSMIGLALAVLATRAHKNLPFYGIAWLFFVPRHIPAPAIPRRIVLLSGAIAAFAIPVISVAIWQLAPWHVVLQADVPMSDGALAMPVQAADYLERTGFRGNVMTFFRHGAYLSWRLYPKVKVSCDGRYEVAYPPADVDRNFAAFERTPQLFRAELARLPQTDLILIDRRMAANKAIDLLSDWTPVYNDETFTLLGRKRLASQSETNARLLPSHGFRPSPEPNRAN